MCTDIIINDDDDDDHQGYVVGEKIWFFFIGFLLFVDEQQMNVE